MNRHKASGLILATGVLAALVTGCGKDAAPTAATPPRSELTQQAADDIAAQFGTTLSRSGGIGINRLGSTSLQAIARGQAPASALRSGSNVTQDEASFSWSFAIRFFDANGGEQPTFDPQTTARLSVKARAHGRATTAETDALIGIERNLDVAGLLPAETTLEIDGTANDTASASYTDLDGSEARHYDIVGAGSLTDVRQLKDESVNPYPLSGTARWNVIANASQRDSSGTASAHYEATVVVTFNGTRHPNVEVEKRFQYTVDLETGKVTQISS